MEWVMVTIVCGVCLVALVYMLRHSISGVFVSRSGFRLFTNSISIQFEIAGKIERIDSSTKKAVRKATTCMKLLDSNKYGTLPEALVINREAVLPLIYAAYENHHTRELSALGAKGYIAEKIYDILESVHEWKKDVPELNDHIIDVFVCRWTKQAIIPNVLRSCHEKIGYYKTLLERDDIIEDLKRLIKTWLEKNEQYVKNLTELTKRLDIEMKLSVFDGTAFNKGETV